MSGRRGPSIRIFSPSIKGDGAQGMEHTFASLMARATDEPDAVYGLAARAVRISPHGLTYRFLMRPSTTSHDGSPLTTHDVAFSLKTLKEKGHPIAQQLLRDLVDAEPSDDATVVVRFAPNRARDVAVRGLATDFLARLLLQACLRRDDMMAVGKPSSTRSSQPIAAAPLRQLAGRSTG
jgi:ABC-type transport system substrate-binding protein